MLDGVSYTDSLFFKWDPILSADLAPPEDAKAKRLGRFVSELSPGEYIQVSAPNFPDT